MSSQPILIQIVSRARKLLLLPCCGAACLPVFAATTAISFNSPAELPFKQVGATTAEYRPRGGASGGDTDGYLSLNDAQGNQRATVVFDDVDRGLAIKAFTFECDLRIGGGTSQPADGFSLNYVRADDPLLASGSPYAGTGSEPNLPEEGSLTGLGIGFDTWQSGDHPGGLRDVVGISIRFDGQLITQLPVPLGPGNVWPGGTYDEVPFRNLATTDANYASSMQTGALNTTDDLNADGTAGNDANVGQVGVDDPNWGLWVKNLNWEKFKAVLTEDGKVKIFWKGVELTPAGGLVSSFTPAPGRFVLGGRTGSAWEVHHVDNIRLETIPANEGVTLGTVEMQAKSVPPVLAHWDFERVEADGVSIKSANGKYVGTINDAAKITEARGGRPGGGRGLDVSRESSRGYLLLETTGDENPMNLAAADDAVTIMLWQKNVSNVDSSSFWFVAESQGRGIQAHIPWSNGRIYLDSNGCCAAPSQRLDQAAPDGFDFTTWHHYAFVKNKEAKQIYIDGELLAEQTEGVLPLPTDFNALYIGSASDKNSPNAVIDDVAIFKGALTQRQIQDIVKGAPIGAPPVDTDKDGMPDTWEVDLGFNPNDASDGPKDFDQDGATNAQEFVAGTNPIDVTKPVLVSAAPSGDFKTVTLTFSEAVEIGSATTLVNYAFSPNLAVIAASVKKNVVTLTTAAQTPGAVAYTVTVNNVVDTSKNAVVSNSKASFYSFLNVKDGVLKLSFWGGINGIPVDNLYQDPRWPASPDMTAAVFAFDSRDALPDDSKDNYGASMEGFLTPAESGSYRFFIYSDDASQLFISSDDNEANLAQIAEETGCCNLFSEPDSLRTSEPVALTAGKKYFVRMVYKEGGGLGYGQIAWRKEGDSTAANKLTPIPGKFLSSAVDLPADPAGAYTQISPAPNAKGVSPAASVTIVHRDGRTPWTAANVSLKYDGQSVTPTVTKDDNIITIKYTPPALAASLSVHTVSLGYLDAGGKAATYDYNFTSGAYSGTTADKVGGYPGLLMGSAVFMADGAGPIGKAGDKVINLTMRGGPVASFDRDFLAKVNQATANDELTVAFWQKKLDIADSSAFTLNSPGSPNNRAFHSHTPWSNQNIYFDTVGCCDSTTQRISADIQTFPGYTGDSSWWTNAYHLFVFTKKGASKNIWIDGQLFLSGENTAQLPVDIDAFYMGSGANGSELSHAIIDDFSVYGKELVEADIMALFQGVLPTALPASKGLIAYWDFNTQIGSPNNATLPGIQIQSVVTSHQLSSGFNLVESAWKINATTVGAVESYQWYKNGEKISGATNNILSVTVPAQLVDNWPDNSYQLVAKNNYGSVTSRVAQIPDRIQWKAADGGNDNYYAVVTDNGRPINWIQASNIAMAFGGHLASVTSDGENKFIYSIIQDSSYWQDVGNGLLGPWIGGQSGPSKQIDDWIWVTGEVWDFAAWNPFNDGSEPNSEPNGGGDWEPYVSFTGQTFAGTKPFWNDNALSQNLRSFIVEWELDTDKDGISDYWETKHGFNPNDPADARLDPDGDGFDNFTEYKADTDPKDVTPPTLVSVEVDVSGTIMTLLFSERIDPLTGSNLANYKISPNLAISAASVRGEKVILTTAPQTRDTNQYTVAVSNVQDLSKQTIAADSKISSDAFDSFNARIVDVSKQDWPIYVKVGAGTNRWWLSSNSPTRVVAGTNTSDRWWMQSNSQTTSSNVGKPLLPGIVSGVIQKIEKVLFRESFETVELRPRLDEGFFGADGFDQAWTHKTPEGWAIDNSNFTASQVSASNPDVNGDGFADYDGVTEWAGWSFAKKLFWQATDGQRRDEFLLGTGNIAVADPDEWDDANHLPGQFNSILKTPPISLNQISGGSLILKFSSSWRPDTTGGNQTGLVMASYDGSEPVVISRWDSVEDGLYYKKDSLSEKVILPINNPSGAQSVVLSFQLKDAGNTWWWAIDDVELATRYYDVNLLGFGVKNIEIEAFSDRNMDEMQEFNEKTSVKPLSIGASQGSSTASTLVLMDPKTPVGQFKSVLDLGFEPESAPTNISSRWWLVSNSPTQNIIPAANSEDRWWITSNSPFKVLSYSPYQVVTNRVSGNPPYMSRPDQKEGRMLGRLEDESISISVRDLNPHSKIQITFDLALFGPITLGERFKLLADNKLIEHTGFDNGIMNVQEYPSRVDGNRFLSYTDSDSYSTELSLNERYSTYRMGYIINHNRSALELSFSTLVSRLNLITNIYSRTGWAVDNLKILVLEDDSTLIGKKSQNITVDGGLDAVYLGPPVSIGGTSDSGLPVVLEVASGPARIEGGQLVPTGAGVVRIRATQFGNGTWAPASIEVDRTVERATQSLAWDPISPQTFGVSPITLLARSDRDLPVVYNLISGPGILSDDQLTITGSGSVVLRATQVGTTNIRPAVKDYSLEVGVFVADFIREVTTGNVEWIEGDRIHSYRVFINSDTAGSSYPITWTNSLNYVRTNLPSGWNLASSTSVAEDDFIWSIIQNSEAKSLPGSVQLWLGGYVVLSGDVPVWTWTDGEEFQFTNWGSGEPNGDSGWKGNVTIRRFDTQQWNDEGGWANGVHGFVAELVRPVSNSKAQTIVVEGGTGAVYLGAPVTIRGTSDSGLPVVLEVASGPARIEGGQLVPTGAGVVRIRATQSGNGTWAPASIEVDRTVDRATQLLTWDPINPQIFGASPITLSAKSDLGLPVSYSVGSGPGTVTGDQLLITGAGTVVVRASQSGTPNVLSVNQDYSVVISKAPQTLSFSAIPNQSLSKTPLQLVGSASSGLPVTFEVVAGPATILNNSLSLSGIGTVTVRARQGGNSNYLEAEPKEQTFVVGRAVQTVSFAVLSGVNYGTSPITLIASSSADLPISLRVVSGPGSINGNILTVSGAGELVVEASQEGNALYLPAKATQTVSVGKASQAITFEALADVAFSTNTILLKATASSGLPVSFRVVSGGVNVSSNALSLSGVGVIQVTAEQAGNTNWLAASSVTNRFTVNRGVQTIEMSGLRDQLLGGAPVELAGVSSAGLAVTYTLVSGPASLSAGKLTLLAEGTVVVRASNPGSTLWLAAQTDASFVIRKQTAIEVTVSGNVGGSVTVSPQKALYEPSETVSVTAVPASGYAFNGWTGDLVGSVNPATVSMSANRRVTAIFTDTAKPVLQWTSPLAGTTGDERAVLTGKLTDNRGVTRATWKRDGDIEQALTLGVSGQFTVDNITLSSGANRFTVKGQDAAGNEVSEERVIVWEPERVLRLADARDVQEGQRVVFPLTLTTPGDVSGLTFRLNYDATYLSDPKVELSALVGQSVNSINTGEAGVISGAFALGGTELPVGLVPVATVSFRARSVPMVLSTEVSVEIDSMSSPDGSALPIGNATMSGWGRIKPRRIKGDNNANQRVDIGDATVISRLQVGLEEKRSWDVALNDLNGSQTIDSGDTVKALRIVVGMDAQPVATASDTKSLARISANQATEAVDLPRPASSKLNRLLTQKSGTTPTERGEWTLPSVAPVVGQTYKLQISLKDLTNAISGLSMKIKYPVGALRLESAQSLKPGAWVPASALTMWNVGPTSTDYVNQNGSVSVAITSQSDWVGTGGVIAELTFRVQAGLTEQATWPIELSEMELTGSGFDIRSLSAVTVQVPGDANAVASRKVSGKVEYYLSTQGGVRGVSLNITEGGGRSAVSAADGTYTIDAPDTGAVTLTPSYATDAPIANGVTTADITLIRRHVLGLTLLDSPYKVMAGDVNGSDSVTTADITLIRRLILGTATTFSGGLWRFVPSDEAFTNTAKPWTATRMRQYASLAAGTLSGQDFKAIKLGDVNGSWKAPTVTTGSIIKSKAKGRLTVGKVRAEVGKPVDIPVSLAGVDQLGSAQMTLSWDASAASYEGVEGLSLGGLSPENLGLARVSEGVLSLSWDHPSGRVIDLTGTAGLFQLKLRPKATTAKRIEIRVTEGQTRLELTDGDTEVLAAVDPGWFELGAPGEVGSDSVSLRFVGLSADGTAQLEVRAPDGVKLALETSDSLKSWAEVEPIIGRGSDTPITIKLSEAQGAGAKFWRTRLR